MRALRVMITVVLAVVALVALLAVLVRLAEARMAFFPMAGEPITPDAVGIAYEPVSVTTRDGETLRAWWMPREAASATVFYLHGNGGNLANWLPVLERVWRRGYAVFALDYRGYGASTGSPSERGLYRDVDAALEAFAARAAEHPQRPVVYWGRSLGAVMAAYAAARRAPDGLVLEAGFPDVRSVLEGSPLWALSWLSSYRFAAATYLEQFRTPTLVIHGDRDSVIPTRLGRKLFERVRGPKRLVIVEGGDHNDLEPADPTAYWQEVAEFVASLPRQ